MPPETSELWPIYENPRRWVHSVGYSASVSMESAPNPSRVEVWGWFELHASQRMQVLGFWLVALGLVTSAYAQTLAAGLRAPAVFMAAMGAVISFLFVLLDRRTRNLVKIAEAEFANLGDSSVARMISTSDGTKITYTTLILLIEVSAAVTQLALAAYAIWCPLPLPQQA